MISLTHHASSFGTRTAASSAWSSRARRTRLAAAYWLTRWVSVVQTVADPTGMGKTCMMASLIHANREDDEPEPSLSVYDEEEEVPAKRRKFVQVTLSSKWQAVANAPKPKRQPPRATLVVCPVSLAAQWADELEKMSTKGSLSCCLWYGNDRADITRLLAQEGKKKVDVVITSYGTLGSEYMRWKKNKEKANYDGSSIYDCELACQAQFVKPSADC